MSKKFDVITVGGAVRDITFYTNKGRLFKTPENVMEQRMLAFEYGAKIPVFDAFFSLGGGALNTANIFSKLNLSTAVIARVGDDEDGRHLSSAMKDKGVITDFIQKDSANRTGLSFIVCTSKKEHEHVAFTYRGANTELEIGEKNLAELDAKWIYLSSLSGNEWSNSLKTLVRFAHEKKIKIAWNPGNAQIQAGKKALEDILPKIDTLILNKDEAIEFVLSGMKIGKRNPSFLNKTLYLLHMLNEWGPRVVVITEGAKGASALYEGKYFKSKAVRKKVIDTTGVGDAFGATFISGLLENRHDIARSLKLGVTNAAHVLMKIGAQEGALTRDELLKKCK